MARRGNTAGVLTRVARGNSNAAVATALRGGDTEGVLSVRRWRGGELDRGESTQPRSTHWRASAPWLRGYARAPVGLRRGLDGVLSAVLARPTERPA
jgi:hypothetical protein